MNYNMDELLTAKFEDMERKIYSAVCEAAREMTRELLEELDRYLMNTRDKKRYENKQIRKATVKTVYGEVEYNRHMYLDRETKHYVYLLEDRMKMEKIGAVSSNLAKIISEAAAEMSYRKTAELISGTTGQTISSHGAWNVVQQIGKEIGREEEIMLNEMEEETTRGETESPIIFMEADGVYLNIQKNKKKAKSQEMKLATVYTGWSKDGKKLVNKKVLAGMAGSTKFNTKTEALIQSVFHIEADQVRVLNGDGAAWISNTYNPERIFQLDRFHIVKKIRSAIKVKKFANQILGKMMSGDYSGGLQDIETYINSIDDGQHKKELKDVRDLYRYLTNNIDGLPRWQEQLMALGIVLQAPEGQTYKNMGVQENQNCSLITNRMKGRKMRWSVEGADNLAKIIYTRENEDLEKIIEKYDGVIILPDDYEKEIQILSADKVQKVIGSGSRYIEILQGALPVLGSPIGNYTDAIRKMSMV